MSSDLNQLRKDIEAKIIEYRMQSDKLMSEFEKTIVGLAQKGYRIDKEKLPDFMGRFWHVYPTKNVGEWEVAVPAFIPFNIGWYDRTEGGYNVFIINKYTKWLGELPVWLSKEVNIPPGLRVSIDGEILNFPEDIQEKVETKFGKHLSLVEKDHATIKQGHEFDLLAEILDTGSLPFVPHPVDPSDLRESKFTEIWDELQRKYIKLEIYSGKYSYQGEAVKVFKKYGAIGIFLLMALGKTVIGTRLYSEVKPRDNMPHCLTVHSIVLIEQWKEFFNKNCPSLLDEVCTHTYQELSRKKSTELSRMRFTLIGFDECHFIPAPTFSKLATVPAIYRFGCSATPYREDGLTNWIIATTGYPWGADSRDIMKVLGKVFHTVNVHVVRDMDSKYALAKQLFNPERRTMFLVDLLAIGNKLADTFEIPFISGETKDRLKLIKENRSFIASRVVDFGISIKDLEHIIEVDFHHGSRQQQVSRTGRLLHSKAETKVHDIIFTKQELEDYGKRLYGLVEKGFQYKLVPHMAGLQVTQEVERKKVTVKGATDIVVELFDDGYFVKERIFPEVGDEVRKRGGKFTTGALFAKLDTLVRQKKLFKIKLEKGYQFKQR